MDEICAIQSDLVRIGSDSDQSESSDRICTVNQKKFKIRKKKAKRLTLRTKLSLIHHSPVHSLLDLSHNQVPSTNSNCQTLTKDTATQQAAEQKQNAKTSFISSFVLNPLTHRRPMSPTTTPKLSYRRPVVTNRLEVSRFRAKPRQTKAS